MKRVGCNRVSPVFPNRGKIYGPLVKWLRHGPFTAVTWVRVPYGSPHRQSVRGLPTIGGLAQLVRAPASHAGGHWFESSSLHQKVPDFVRNQELFLFMLSNSDAAFGRFLLDPNAERAGKHRRWARQGMFPCQALRSFSFLLFQSTGIPDPHSVAKFTNSVGASIFLLRIFTMSLACGMVKASTYAR